MIISRTPFRMSFVGGGTDLPCKKQLAAGISNSRIDECYERARRAGALGGKLLGAGESGFLLLFCEPRIQSSVREKLTDLREISFRYEQEGSKIIYVGG